MAQVLWFLVIRNADKEDVLYLVGFQGDISGGTKLITLLDNVINFVPRFDMSWNPI
jgi:hypothetical protein